MVHEKAPPTKKDLSTPIWMSWNHSAKEYGLKLVKSMPERIEAIIKA